MGGRGEAAPPPPIAWPSDGDASPSDEADTADDDATELELERDDADIPLGNEPTLGPG